MSYVQGFLIPVKTANKEAFTRYAAVAAEWLKKEGALHVMETWGTDVPDGKTNSMKSAVLLELDETVVFSWVVWPDEPTASAAMGKMMDADEFDPRTNPMPFEGERMIFGGFEPVVDV